MTLGFSIIIVNYGTFDLLLNFLNSIEENIDKREAFEVIIVDNGFPHKGDSRDFIYPDKFSFKLRFAQNPKTSYASAINLGALLATYDTIIAANSDIEIPRNFSLDALINIFKQNRKIGIVGPQLIYPDGTWQRSYGPFPSVREQLVSLSCLDIFSHVLQQYLMNKKILLNTPKSVNYVDGAFMIVRKECFDECGGFNEDYQFYGEDVDFCWRAKKIGWDVIFIPNLRIIHLRGASSTQKSFVKYMAHQFMAKLQFVSKNNGYRYANCYKQLIKAVMLQRHLFYSAITKLIPIRKLKCRKDQAKLRYTTIKNLYKIQ